MLKPLRLLPQEKDMAKPEEMWQCQMSNCG